MKDEAFFAKYDQKKDSKDMSAEDVKNANRAFKKKRQTIFGKMHARRKWAKRGVLVN